MDNPINNLDFELVFVGDDNARHCTAIGADTHDRYFEYNTGIDPQGWEITELVKYKRSRLGIIYWAREQVQLPPNDWKPLSELTSTGVSISNPGRTFMTGKGMFTVWYEWRTYPGMYDYYELWKVPGHEKLAIFGRAQQDTAVGPSWATMKYSFFDEELLDMAMLALCICRVKDGH